MLNPLSPTQVLESIAHSLPGQCRQNVIIIGSLAAAFNFFEDDEERSIRTKDVDCMFVPHAKAVGAAVEVTRTLMDAGWQQRTLNPKFAPGDANTPKDKLPMIRLVPPGVAGGAQWFLEMLGAPDADSVEPKSFHRIETPQGHLVICSFNYLALAEWNPIRTKFEIHIARPEMMALANMLHHTYIADTLIEGTSYKRSNKDLGRVLALAWLTASRDSKTGSQELSTWHDSMAQALRDRFPNQAPDLAKKAGSGIRELLNRPKDLDQALSVCNQGLLSSIPIDALAFEAMGRRFVRQVIDPLEAAF